MNDDDWTDHRYWVKTQRPEPAALELLIRAAERFSAFCMFAALAFPAIIAGILAVAIPEKTADKINLDACYGGRSTNGK